MMRKIFILALVVVLLFSCNKEDRQRLEELQLSLEQIEGRVDEIVVPDAVEPWEEDLTEYSFSFDKEKYGVDAGGSVAVGYRLPESSTVSVNVKDGWNATVNATSATEGTIVVSVPDPASPSQVTVTATTEGGKSTAATLPVMVRDPYSDATRPFANLMGYYSLKPQWATLENFQKLADAGLKMVTVECEDPDYVQQISYAHQVGMKSVCIIGWAGGRYAQDPQGYKGLDNIVNELKVMPGVYAYHICDEPSTKDIPRLKMIKEKVESLDPDHQVYINLNPDGSENALGTTSYREYIEAYARDCEVDFISFDMYPILPGGQVMPGWHKCLRAVYDVTRKYGIPFWAFAASCWINNEGGIIVRGKPSVENLRLQTYTDLAYGAQVVQYFTIQQYGGTTLAPIMHDGTWTEAYDYLKETGLQVQRRGYVFDGCKVDLVRFSETPATWGENLSDADMPEEIGSMTTSGTAMVSFVENRGNRYIVAVNQSYTDKITAKVTFNDMVYTIERDGSFVEHGRGTEEFTIDEGDLMVIKVK